MKKIAGVVVVFHPIFDNLITNIKTYYNNIEKLYIILNSQINLPEREQLQSLFSTSEIIEEKSNTGIAKALNRAAKKATIEGFEWLLTMDQDSKFLSNQYFEQFRILNNESVAIFCPNPESSDKIDDDSISKIDEPLVAITSGSLLRLSVWKITGGFNENLFIDEVDHDYCLRINLAGYKINQFVNIGIAHQLGEPRKVQFLGYKTVIYSHSPTRIFYIVRNNFYIFKKYKKYFPSFIRTRKKMLLIDLIKIILFESKKLAYFSAIIKGYYGLSRLK